MIYEWEQKLQFLHIKIYLTKFRNNHVSGIRAMFTSGPMKMEEDDDEDRDQEKEEINNNT
jgi:hypothetical protein